MYVEPGSGQFLAAWDRDGKVGWIIGPKRQTEEDFGEMARAWAALEGRPPEPPLEGADCPTQALSLKTLKEQSEIMSERANPLFTPGMEFTS